MRTGTTRGLAAALQTWDDERLEHLLRLRPDLARPVPVGATGLAARACSEASLRPATLDLTRADLAAAQAISRGLPAAAEPEERLRERAIVWDEEHPVVAGWVARKRAGTKTAAAAEAATAGDAGRDEPGGPDGPVDPPEVEQHVLPAPLSDQEVVGHPADPEPDTERES